MEKLRKIQSELVAPKNQFNSFGNYKYRSCEDILEALKPLLTKYNCYLIIKDDIVMIGNRYYVKAVATLLDIDTATSFESIAYARESETKKGMDESQITGATSSYARKYALNGLFCIDDSKDADSTNTQNKEKEEIFQGTKPLHDAVGLVECDECGAIVSEKVKKYSEEKFKRCLCFNCQKGALDAKK